MPPADSSALIVARFLKSNHYDQSYEAFIAEAGLPQDAGNVSKGDLTLETLLEEKKTFDISVQFEKLGTDETAAGWTEPAPSVATTVDIVAGKSNLLSAAVEEFRIAGSATPFLLATSASRYLHAFSIPSLEVWRSTNTLQDSPILSCAVLRQNVLITTSMSGQVVASDVDGNAVDKRRDHMKYCVQVAVLQGDDYDTIATAGWDNKINVYRSSSNSTTFKFGDPFTITLTTKPEAILLLKHPETSTPIIIVTRADSNNLYFYTTDTGRLLGQQNLAPHSNAWVAFTPSALALCPTDSSLIAAGTNSLPHMKLLIVRLLIPPWDGSNPVASDTRPPVSAASLLDPSLEGQPTQASQARLALAIANSENAAIQIHCMTMAPQTAYSTPAIAWRPDGSGVWVNGDDGAVRGIEASSGKVVETLKGHEEGSKVRCLWAGRVEGEEWVVSGGFDQRLIVWKAGEGSGE